ncbi:MAG: DUF3604 domain-containing protein [Myxococcota bacterium]
MKNPIRKVLFAVLALILVAGACLLNSASQRIEDPSLEPAFDAASAKPPVDMPKIPAVATRRALFGDLHVHTSYSVDAFVFGVRALPDDAYRFAKGGAIEHGAGYPIQLSRPLDFLAVTDHAEYLGTARAAQPDVPTVRQPLREALLNSNSGQLTKYWSESVMALTNHKFNGGDVEFGDPEANIAIEAAAWEDTIAAAERHNNPGTFTAFIGYEWSSWGVHRNIIYNSRSVPERPFSSVDSNEPQDLWTALESQRALGQKVIAIPHNMNESSGRMYPDKAIEELKWTRAEAMRRRTIEPVSEIFQVKGSSETHPALSPEDPFADFEIVERPSMDGNTGGPDGGFSRDALRSGLELAMQEGWNPYVLGVIGSSDSHNASATVEEDNHHGKLPVLDGSAGIRSGEALLLPSSSTPGATWGGGGLAAVWAEENTRASIFEALERRETFATSGPRMQVRFFGGWSLDPASLSAGDAVETGYRDGVSMGGFLPARPRSATTNNSDAGAAPQFLVWADKDPAGAHLDRLQIIKGWMTADGTSRERVYDLVASGDRSRDRETGLFETVGNTVDVPAATYTNTIGAAHLEAHWTDPDFDPDHDAFYYVRVLEIPTPRMSTFDAKALGIEAPEPATLQERATTSAIWYDQSGLNGMQ